MGEKPSFRVIWSWLTVLLTAAVLLSGCIFWLLPQIAAAVCIPLWGIFAAVGSIWLPLRWRRMRFSIAQGYVCVYGGVWITGHRMMAIDSIRQVTVWQGPVERICHTAFLLIRSTGGYLLLEGVEQARVEEWCRHLTAHA